MGGRISSSVDCVERISVGLVAGITDESSVALFKVVELVIMFVNFNCSVVLDGSTVVVTGFGVI